MPLRLPLALLALLTVLVAAGCGSSGDDAPDRVRIALDFTPNAVHAPIYAAARTGADRRHGVSFSVVRPGSRPDSLKTVLTGRADLGVLDIGDLAIARAKDVPVVAVGALVQRPLGALIAQPSIARPRDLAGKTVGVSGLPSDPPFVSAIVGGDGGDASGIREVTIGFTAVSALLSGKVQAVPAFWNVEGVELAQRGRRMNVFKIDDYGAPPFPEVVLFTTRRMLAEHRDRVEAALAAIGDGARAIRADPAAATQDILRASGEGRAATVRAQLRALAPIVDPRLTLRRAVLERWSSFTARVGLTDGPTDVSRAFAFGLTP